MVKSIIGARGTNHVVKGQINLPLNFDGKVIYQYFQIIPELRNSLILGMDFLKANQALINIGQKELILNKKGKTKILLVKKDVGCIRISSKIKIFHQSTRYIPVKLSNVNSMSALVRPINYISKNNLILQTCIITNKHRRSYVNIIIPTHE